jgi:uncharacterized membrane protein
MINSCAGQSKADYEGTVWKYVPKGTCEKMKAPNGTPPDQILICGKGTRQAPFS